MCALVSKKLNFQCLGSVWIGREMGKRTPHKIRKNV